MMGTIAPPAARALARLHEAGFEAWLVGGCVRDMLLGCAPKDYDLATSARPEETKAVFQGETVLETGIRHGTVTVLLEGMPLEITTYRVDGAYSDARHPDGVTFADNLRADAARRDFTINAMAYAPGRGLRDYFGGQADLRAGCLRAVGDPGTRFQEDALRILRGLRFAAVLDFSLEEETDRAARRYAPLLTKVSAERCAAELGKLLCGPAAGRILRAYPAVLGVVIPELLPMVGFAHRNAHHCYDVWTPGSLCAWRCCCTTWESQIPFLWERMGRDISTGTPGGAWSWRKESSPGCGFPGGPGSKCCAWCATMTRSSRRAPSGCAAGSTNWGRSAFLICWRSSGAMPPPRPRHIAQGWTTSGAWKRLPGRSWLRRPV